MPSSNLYMVPVYHAWHTETIFPWILPALTLKLIFALLGQLGFNLID